MTRTPFIAGNWKMNKTVAEAERYIQALLPQVAAVDGVEIVVCPPFLALGALVDSARGSQVGIYAQNMHEADTGAYTGEVSAAMLSELDVAGVVLGHSERRQYFDETDKALQLKVPKALETGLTPILCVGESEDERERGETERGCATRSRRGSRRSRPSGCRRSSSPTSRSGRSGPARPRRPTRRRRRARSSARWWRTATRRRPSRCAWSTAARCKPDNAAELLALADVDGALVGGASLDPADFNADRRGRRRVTRPAVCLVVLDGWALAPDGPGNAVALADTPVVRRAVGALPARAADAPAARPSACPRGRWATPRSATSTSAPARSCRRTSRGSTTRSPTARWRENEALRAALGGAERVHLIGLVSDGGVHSSEEHLKALIGLAAELERAGPRRPRLHRRPRHVADVRRGVGRGGRGDLPRAGAGRVGSVDRPLLRDGPRPALGAHRAGARPALRGHRPSTTPTPARQAVKAAYERDETDEFITADDGRRGGADPARRRRPRVQLPARPDAPDHDEADRGRRPLHDADRVRRGLDVPGRLPAAAAGDHDRRGSSRTPGARSSTSPRPRSTRT